MPDAGDDWADWLDRHGPALVLFARSWVPTRADAEDVVQEAFVRFWQARDRAADPTAFLFGCVKRGAVDWMRGRGRRARREAAVAKPEGEELFDGPLEQAERRAAVAAAIAELPAAQREVLIMRIWGALTFPQIAGALDIPADTAASRVRYALARLRGRLAEESIP